MSKLVLRNKALELRKLGYSYNYISEKIQVSKSTLSNWLALVSYTPNAETIERMGRARAASGLAKHKLKLASLSEAEKEAKEELKAVSERDVFLFGLGLYLGEGTKTHGIVRVINANPQVIKFAVRWFRDVCGMTVKNFRIRLHLYPDNDIKESVRHWSLVTGVPTSQFQTAYIDLRKGKKRFKRGSLPFGTAHLSIRSNGNKKHGVFLSRKINAWIEEVLK